MKLPWLKKMKVMLLFVTIHVTFLLNIFTNKRKDSYIFISLILKLLIK